MVVHLLTTKKRREMKKFWNLLVAVLVVMGAVACTENYENVDGTMEQGLSFRATINLDETRSDVVFNEATEKWNTVWTGDETLNVRVGLRSYQFTNSVEDKELFVCNTANASDLVGQDVVIDLMHDAEGTTLDSKAGKSGGKIYASVSSFNPAEGVALEVKSAFFRYSSAYEVTLDASSYIFYYNDGYKNSITLPAGDDVWVAFNPLSDVTLSYSIDGTKCKEITKNFESKKVYNLGELGLPYEVSETWGVAGDFNGWAAGTPAPLYVVNEWLVAYGLTNLNGGFKFVQNKSWDNAKGGVPAEGVASATGEWLNCGTNNITVADASAYDVYFAPERSMYCIVVAGAVVPEMPEAPVLPDWSLAGSFNNWGDLLMTATDTAYLYVAEGVTLATGDEIKVKRSDTWDVSYGGGINNLEPNKWMKAYLNGSNVVVAKSGTYDVYFEYADGGDYSKLYLVEAGESQSAATEQTANGTLVPDGSDTPEGVTPDEPSVWSLSGTFNGWGDAVMVTTTVKDIFVAKSVSFAAYDSFKVRKNKAWTENYGGGIVYFNPNGWMSVYSNGSDIAITEAGTYDVYFDLTNKRLYVVDAGGDYTTVAQQTTEGKEPEVEEPEVTENVLYLKPNSNWKQSNARFAAYFFNNAGNAWVSMVDSDSDGIYEVNIPEGYTFGDNVIFCRMNPSSTANNWNNKWNQTADLKIPTDGKNLFTIPGTTWDGATNSNWSVKE